MVDGNVSIQPFISKVEAHVQSIMMMMMLELWALLVIIDNDVDVVTIIEMQIKLNVVY